MRLRLADGSSRRELRRAGPADDARGPQPRGEGESTEYEVRVGLSGVDEEDVQDSEVVVAFSSADRLTVAFKLCCAFVVVASSFLM